MRRDLQGLLAQVDAHNTIYRRKNQDNAWSFGVFQEAAKAEDHTTFVFAQNLDGTKKVKSNDDNDDQAEIFDEDRHSHQKTAEHYPTEMFFFETNHEG